MKSERRNPVFADVFSRMNLMERRGSGLREICTATAAKDAYRPEFKPLFESKQDAFWVTLRNMNHEAGGASGTQVSTQVAMVPEAIGDQELSTPELVGVMGFSERSTFRKNYLKPALDAGAIERTIHDKPNSRNQKYRRAE